MQDLDLRNIKSHKEGEDEKEKTMIILAAIAAVVIVAIVVISQSSNWSTLSYEAVVQETVTMSDGEIRLIVERTTEIYGNPLNSLHIGEETELLDIDGNKISVEDLQPGIKVKVTLKDSFTEETPFYYPIVYEIKTI